MIKVSSKSTYALRALMDLSQHADGTPIRLPEIADRQHIPLPFLEQIFSTLRKAGLVQAVRGPQGGYHLTKAPHEITLGDIITATEGPLEPVLCSMPENRTPNCHDVDGCVSRLLCCELDGALKEILARNTLASLAQNPGILEEPHRTISIRKE
jgi:Rrf2 family protein